MMEDAATEQLSAYLDGELTDAEITELEHRLAQDPALRDELDQLRGAIDLLRTHGPAQTPPSLYGDILAAVADEPMPGGFWTWLQRPFGLPLPALAVAFVAVLVLGVTVTGALVMGGDEVLRPAVSKNPLASGWSEKDAKSEELKNADAEGKLATRTGAKKPVAKAASKQSYGAEVGSAEVGDAGNAELTVPGSAAQASGTSKTLSNAMEPTEGSADSEGAPLASGEAASGTAEDDMQISSGSSVYSVGLRGEDLEDVASIYQRYAGTSKVTSGKAQQIASLSPGTHEITLTLPKGADRNAFKQELERRHPGTFKEIITTDDTITLDNTVVTLRLTVSPYLPESSGTYEAPITTIRKEGSPKARTSTTDKKNPLPESKPLK
ncbi:MAG: sigma-E factor negative regulatory protein [Myxococcota bacterium]